MMREARETRHPRLASALLLTALALGTTPCFAAAVGDVIPGAAAILFGDRFIGGGDGNATLTGRSVAADSEACIYAARPAAFGNAAERLVFGVEGLRCGGYVIRPASAAMVFAP